MASSLFLYVVVDVNKKISLEKRRENMALIKMSSNWRRPVHQRGDFSTHSTEELLRDHTVLELASQHVAICAPSNINPCTQTPRRLPRLQHPLTSKSPARSPDKRGVSMGGARNATPALRTIDDHRAALRGDARIAKPAASSSYHTYHQLQCPMCRAASTTTYVQQNRDMFVSERLHRDTIRASEGAERAAYFRSFMIGIAAIERAALGPVALAVPNTSLPPSIVDDLSAWELSERLELSKRLWKQLRSLHFTMEAAVHRSGSESLRTSKHRHRVGDILPAALEAVSAAMEALAPEHAALQAMHAAQRRALKADERDRRSSVELDYLAVVAMCEISASAWRASASKSLEQRRLQEQVHEQQKQLTLEAKTREFLARDEGAAWGGIMTQVREHTGAFRLLLVQNAMVALVAKEEKIRCDRFASFAAERDAILHRAVSGLEDGDRRCQSDTALTSQGALLRTHIEWVHARTPEDLEGCREWHSKGTVEAAVSTALGK